MEALYALEVPTMRLAELLFIVGFEQHDLMIEVRIRSIDLQFETAGHSSLTLRILEALESHPFA